MVNSLSERATFSIKVILKNFRAKLLELERLCESLSYRKTLERGYVIVRNRKMEILEQSVDVETEKIIYLEFKDDQVIAEVKDEK